MDTFNKHINAMKNEAMAMSYDIEPALDLFRKHNRVIFCTMGKSAFACAKVVYTARSYGLPWYDLDVCHAFHGDAGIIQHGDLLVHVSKSGETKEVLEVADYFKDFASVAMVSDKECNLAKKCNEIIHIPCENEGSPFGYAPMISTSLYMIVLHGILAEVVDHRGITLAAYAKNHPGGSIGRDLKSSKKKADKKDFDEPEHRF